MKELVKIQKHLKAPKGQYNSFGKYHYRSAEDILNSVKPLLAENECTLTITDDIVSIGGFVYVKATAMLKNANNETESTTAFAREDAVAKGMSGSQITGSTSSYARKYALNGLFCIDDTKDADATNDGTANANNNRLQESLNRIAQAKSRDELNTIWNTFTDLQKDERFSQAMANACQKYPKQ